MGQERWADDESDDKCGLDLISLHPPSPSHDEQSVKFQQDVDWISIVKNFWKTFTGARALENFYESWANDFREEFIVDFLLTCSEVALMKYFQCSQIFSWLISWQLHRWLQQLLCDIIANYVSTWHCKYVTINLVIIYSNHSIYLLFTRFNSH